MSLEDSLTALSLDVAALSGKIVSLTGRIASLEVALSPPPAPEPVPAPTPTYPVRCADPARDYYYYGPGARRDTVMAWLAPRLSLTESEAATVLPATYPGKVWKYALCMSVMTSCGECAAMPNDNFVQNPDGSRLVQHIWTSDRWFWALSKPAVRALVVQRMVAACANYDGLFLDEHANITQVALADVAQLLTEMRAALPGKFLIVNSSESSTYPGYAGQVLAAGGVCTELAWRSNGVMRATGFGPWATLIHQVSQMGGVALLTGTKGNNGPVGDASRELLWRLAAYWLVSGPGVYLDLLSTGDDTHPQWQPCLSVDLGPPVGELVTTSYGKQGDWTVWVHRREFTKAVVYLRVMDGWNVTEFGDPSAVTIPVTAGLKRLAVDGTVGPPVSSIALRTADSAILMK